MFRNYLNIILGFLCYSAVLCIQINRFQFEGAGLKCVNFSSFCKL